MNAIRLAKPGSDWTINELIAYNIVIREQDQVQFFGGPLPAYAGPGGFFDHEDRVQGLDSASLSLIKRLDLAGKIKEGQESAVDDFVAALLMAMGYEHEDTVIRTRGSIWLLVCGEMKYAKTDVCVMKYAKTDVCVMDAASEVLLLVQEDKRHINPSSDPEPQLIAEAIAAFQRKNATRGRIPSLPPLEAQMIPGITMVGTFPRFYKIKITTELDMAVRVGQYPAMQTVVYRHTPCAPALPGRVSDGMRPLDNRRYMLQCYEAFKQFVYPNNEPGPPGTD